MIIMDSELWCTANYYVVGCAIIFTNTFEHFQAMKYIGQDRILYANPLWTRANIRHAKECEVQLVVIESGDDLKRFSQYFPEANIILRVVMDPPLMNGLVLMDKLNVEKAIELLCVAKDLPCKITGIRFYISLRLFFCCWFKERFIKNHFGRFCFVLCYVQSFHVGFILRGEMLLNLRGGGGRECFHIIS